MSVESRSPRGIATHSQRGQALIETLVVLMALLPLLLGLVWLGKVMALRQSAIEASRLLAFECSVRLDTCAQPTGQAQLADEIRRRVFSRVDAPIRSQEVLADQPRASERNTLTVDEGGRPLLARMSDIGIRVETQSFDAGLSVATTRARGTTRDALELLSDLAGPGRFGLGLTDGLRVATVQARVVPIEGARWPWPELRLQARTALLTDAWTASGPMGTGEDSVQARVQRGAQIQSLAEAALEAVYLPVRGFMLLMQIAGLEPLAGAFRWHHTDVDVVPADRLGDQP